MMNNYLEIVKKYCPREDRFKNAMVSFICGGLLGSLSELLLRCYMMWLDIPRKESGIVVILTLIIIASVLTVKECINYTNNRFCSFDDFGSIGV